MSETNFNRRDFLKVMGWGGAAVTLTGCGFTSVEDGRETVLSYVEPPEFALPGIGVYYNTTCTQCSAGCGVTGRVREGRVLKLEGNPVSPVNRGKMCGLGQAGVQAHYNPDRLRQPMLGGQPVSWERAYALIAEKLGANEGSKVAFLTGAMSGHLRVLLGNYLEALGSKQHYAYEAVGPSVLATSNKAVYGTEMPVLNLERAKLVLSFGADFLGSWVSPVHFSQQYAAFRKGNRPEGRGVLIQVEPKMTLTGANADRWVAVRPGTEAVFALGLLRELGAQGVALPAGVADAVGAYDLARVSGETGVPAERISKVVASLKSHAPSLVLAGDSAEGYVHGSQLAAAVAMLNHVLGNEGKTISAPAEVAFPQIAPIGGTRAALGALSGKIAGGEVQTLFVLGANPVYSAPASSQFAQNFKAVPFKVVLAEYLDETAQAADLVLPLDSGLEAWGTSVPAYRAVPQLNIQQPLMERLSGETRSAGDVLLALLKQQRPDDYKDQEDYYAYLRNSVVAIKAVLGGASQDDDSFWDTVLSKGVVDLPQGSAKGFVARVEVAQLALPATPAQDAQYPLRLIPSVSASMRDGRHANQPWLQEVPDPLTTIVWDSWMEIHPATAAKLGIVEGDIVEISSRNGVIQTQAYIFPGIHPDAISVPLGYGHSEMGRYAKGVGANAFAILDAAADKATGEPVLCETRVTVRKVGKRVAIAKDEGAAGGKQMGKKIAVRVASDKIDLSKEV